MQRRTQMLIESSCAGSIPARLLATLKCLKYPQMHYLQKVCSCIKAWYKKWFIKQFEFCDIGLKLYTMQLSKALTFSSKMLPPPFLYTLLKDEGLYAICINHCSQWGTRRPILCDHEGMLNWTIQIISSKQYRYSLQAVIVGSIYRIYHKLFEK